MPINNNNVIKFDFDDILIVPAVTSEITSRYNDIELPEMLPLFTAPMDTVVDLNNIDLFIDNGINVILPRTIKYNGKITHYKYCDVFISLGFDDIEFYLKTKFKNFQLNAHILFDVANGHMLKIVDYAKAIKAIRPDIIIMVGNIANPETYAWYAENDCVDYIRVIIGAGGACLTSKNSGVGYASASLISEIYHEKQKFIDNNEYKKIKYNPNGFNLCEKPVTIIPKIVADGGMKNYSDIIKALALGADYVAIGSIFNKALESCADNYLFGIKLNNYFSNYFFNKGFPIKKYFRGMSTKDAQKAMGKTTIKTSEGVVRYRKVEYHLDGWIENFKHYLRNAMSYSNAKTLDDFIGKANICQITKNSYDRFNK